MFFACKRLPVSLKALCFCLTFQAGFAQISPKKPKPRLKTLTTLSTQPVFPKPRPTFLSLDFRRIAAFPVHVVSEKYGNTTSGNKFNQRIQVKLNAPLVLKPNFQLLAGLRFQQEEFRFENIALHDVPAHYLLDDRHLYSFGYRLYFSSRLSDTWTLKGGMGADLNGDQLPQRNLWRCLRHNYFGLLEKTVNPRTEWGFGLAFGYDLGRAQVYPILRYAHQFNQRWSMELSLPKEVRATYAFSPKMYLVGEAKLSGAAYCLNQPLLRDVPVVEFRESHVELSLEWQREIHDWLWMSIQGGMLKTLNMRVSEIRQPDFLLRVRSVEAPFVNVTLYLVPPRKMMSKKL